MVAHTCTVDRTLGAPAMWGLQVFQHINKSCLILLECCIQQVPRGYIQVWLYIMNKVTNTKTIQNDMYTVYMYTGCKISEWGVCMCVRLIQQAWFVGGHHVFDVDKRIISAVDLKRLQCLLNQVTNVLPLLLAVVNPITRVHWSRGRERRKIVSMNYTKQYKDEGTSYQ